MTIFRWILAALLTAFFLFFGAEKFIVQDEKVFSLIAERSGIALFDPELKYATGVLELLAGALIAAPRTRPLGLSLGLVAVGGAIGFHLSPWLGIDVPGIGPGLFAVAVAAFGVTLTALLVERHARRRGPGREPRKGEGSEIA